MEYKKMIALAAIALFVLLLAGCKGTGEIIDVGPLDFAVTVATVEIDVTSGELMPGVPNAKFEGDGCTAIVRNAAILGSVDLVKLLTNLNLESGDGCSLKGTVEGTGTVLAPPEPVM